MSKIQFNELNQNASELEVLNETEITEVVGGHSGHSGHGGHGGVFGSDFSSRTNVALVSADNNALVSQHGLGNYAHLGQGSHVSVNQG